MFRNLKVFFLSALVMTAMSGLCFASGRKDGSEKDIFKAQKSYDSSRYLTAVGSGSTVESASSSAKLALCQILGESIEGQQKVFQSASSTGEESALLEVNINERAIFDHITGITIASSARGSDGLMYSLAVLDKVKVADYYFSKANELNMQVDSLVKKAERASDTTSMFDCLFYMKEAVEQAQENAYNVALLEVLDSSRGRVVSLAYQSPSQLRVKRLSLGRGMRVSVKVSGSAADKQYLSRLEGAFASYLSDQGVTVVGANAGSAGASGTSASVTHELTVNLTFEEVPSADDKFKYVRYSLVSSFTQRSDGKSVSYAKNGREGHLSLSQAKDRCILRIEEDITENFPL